MSEDINHTNLEYYLTAGKFVDSDHPDIQSYTTSILQGIKDDPVDQSVALFYAVRDDIRYDPYSLSLDENDYKASNIQQQTGAFCIPKAILLTAVTRAAGIPCRLGFADVRNHLTTDKLKAAMKGNDLFIYHGYVETWLKGKWVKSTPAFNLELCKKFGVLPLDYNGTEDALMHPFDAEGRQHMEYINDHGTFHDFPMIDVFHAMNEAYGDLRKMMTSLNGDFAKDASSQGKL